MYIFHNTLEGYTRGRLFSSLMFSNTRTPPKACSCLYILLLVLTYSCKHHNTRRLSAISPYVPFKRLIYYDRVDLRLQDHYSFSGILTLSCSLLSLFQICKFSQHLLNVFFVIAVVFTPILVLSG